MERVQGNRREEFMSDYNGDSGHFEDEFLGEDEVEQIDPQTGEALEPSYLRVGKAKRVKKGEDDGSN